MGEGALLVHDEIQKIDNWSEIIKKLWDASRIDRKRLKVVLLGSSSLALQIGLSESLTGRFELIRVFHWNYGESQQAFGHSLADFLRFGGYPGADRYRDDEPRWLAYVKSAIVETVLEKDIMQLRRVERPALFKQVFELLCGYPASEISLRKIVRQLQDPGSIETVKHYIELLDGAFLIKTLLASRPSRGRFCFQAREQDCCDRGKIRPQKIGAWPREISQSIWHRSNRGHYARELPRVYARSWAVSVAIKPTSEI